MTCARWRAGVGGSGPSSLFAKMSFLSLWDSRSYCFLWSSRASAAEVTKRMKDTTQPATAHRNDTLNHMSMDILHCTTITDLDVERRAGPAVAVPLARHQPVRHHAAKALGNCIG